MTETTKPDAPGTMAGDVFITLGLGLVFALAYIGAGDWAFKTALFPRLISAVGVALSFGRLAQLAVRSRKGRAEPGKTAAPSEVREIEDPARVLRESSAGVWAGALLWLLAFFVALAVLGTFVTVPVFALVYLAVVARLPLWAAVVHAVTAASIVYFVFDRLLAVPLPEGMLF